MFLERLDAVGIIDKIMKNIPSIIIATELNFNSIGRQTLNARDDISARGKGFDEFIVSYCPLR
jgi:hypothetical protein